MHVILFIIFFQITNKELLHAVVGLYDVSLGEMTPDTLYATVCERWARTIILLRDVNGKKLWVFVSVLIRCTQYAKYILFYTVGPRNKVHPRLSFFPKNYPKCRNYMISDVVQDIEKRKRAKGQEEKDTDDREVADALKGKN